MLLEHPQLLGGCFSFVTPPTTIASPLRGLQTLFDLLEFALVIFVRISSKMKRVFLEPSLLAPPWNVCSVVGPTPAKSISIWANSWLVPVAACRSCGAAVVRAACAKPLLLGSRGLGWLPHCFASVLTMFIRPGALSIG